MGTENNRGVVDIFENSEFPVSPETENSHWLKGDKKVFSLTTSNMIMSTLLCGLQQLPASTYAMIHNGVVVRILFREISTWSFAQR